MIREDAKLCKMEFFVEAPGGEQRLVQAWLEDNAGCPSLQAKWKNSCLGMTCDNYSSRSDLDNLVILTREFYRILRETCYLREYKEPPHDTPIYQWIGDVLDTLKNNRDMVLERAS